MTFARRGYAYATLAAALIAVALAYRWPLLRTGFTVDDFAQLAMMRGEFWLPRSALKLFTFCDGSVHENLTLRAAGFFPWWSHAHFKLSLFRPLASALMWLDLRWFGDAAFGYHLHSALWWVLMMAALALTLCALLPPWAALLALAICLAHSSHTTFLAWIANRNALVSSAFALFGLWWLLRDSARARWLALACFALALAAGEYALGFLPYAVCLVLFGAEPRRRIVPWLGLTGCYLLLRAGLGFGTRGSGMYIDPFGEPVAFVSAALVRLPLSAAELVFGAQSNWYTGGYSWANAWAALGLLPQTWLEELRPLQHAHLALGACALVVAFAIGVLLWRERSLRWLIAGSALALVPSLASITESRLLFPPLFGAAVIVAHGVQATRARWWFALLAACVLIGPPLYVAPTIRGIPDFARGVRASLLDPTLDAPIASSARVLLLAAADATTTIYLPLVRRLANRTAPASCQLLSSSSDLQRLERSSLTTFTLERLGSHLSPLDYYASAFNRGPFTSGERFESPGMRVTIERAEDGRPMRTRFELDQPLERMLLLQQTVGGLRPVSFPAVGASMVVEPPVPPYQLMMQP